MKQYGDKLIFIGDAYTIVSCRRPEPKLMIKRSRGMIFSGMMHSDSFFRNQFYSGVFSWLFYSAANPFFHTGHTAKVMLPSNVNSRQDKPENCREINFYYRTFGRILRTNFKMTTRKKKSPPQTANRKQKNVAAASNFSKVEEPEVAYGKISSAGRTIIFMGTPGKKDFLPVTNESDFIDVIRKGIPKKAIDTLIDKTGIPVNEMAVLMRLSDRTLRRYKPQTLLNPEQSERVVELARLYSRGEEVFGNLESFKEWMNSTVMALGNIKPKELLDTSLGIEILMNELGKIEHGIFA